MAALTADVSPLPPHRGNLVIRSLEAAGADTFYAGGIYCYDAAGEIIAPTGYPLADPSENGIKYLYQAAAAIVWTSDDEALHAATRYNRRVRFAGRRRDRCETRSTTRVLLHRGDGRPTRRPGHQLGRSATAPLRESPAQGRPAPKYHALQPPSNRPMAQGWYDAKQKVIWEE